MTESTELLKRIANSGAFFSLLEQPLVLEHSKTCVIFVTDGMCFTPSQKHNPRHEIRMSDQSEITIYYETIAL